MEGCECQKESEPCPGRAPDGGKGGYVGHVELGLLDLQWDIIYQLTVPWKGEDGGGP